MSVLVRFPVEGLTRQQYDEVNRRLEESGSWPPAGLQLHVCFGSEGDLKVSEMWESAEQMQAYDGKELIPVLKDVGVRMSGAPEVFEVVNVDQPKAQLTT